jgi:2,3-bisphosphoglycerate-independent phosphoglycerate mutase
MRIHIAPDHYTTIQTRTHAGGPVPFGLCGAGVPVDGQTAYSEKIAANTNVLIEEGYTLIERMIREPVLVF